MAVNGGQSRAAISISPAKTFQWNTFKIRSEVSKIRLLLVPTKSHSPRPPLNCEQSSPSLSSSSELSREYDPASAMPDPKRRKVADSVAQTKRSKKQHSRSSPPPPASAPTDTPSDLNPSSEDDGSATLEAPSAEESPSQRKTFRDLVSRCF